MSMTRFQVWNCTVNHNMSILMTCSYVYFGNAMFDVSVFYLWRHAAKARVSGPVRQCKGQTCLVYIGVTCLVKW